MNASVRQSFIKESYLLTYFQRKYMATDTLREQKFHRMKVPGNESSIEISFPGTKRPGSEKARERIGQGARRPESERATERKFQGANWPGSYWPIRSVE